ncbi:MAG: WxcM-like domain-containing protein [Opitutales bacterium]|nr:WxcM-like domain-containing protein [Opitutales bacterium]
MEDFLRDIKLIEDARGKLVVFENGNNCPFEVKRAYCIFGVKEGEERGFHAHKNLEQIAVCLSGSCEFILDDGKEQKTFALNSPKKGLYIGNNYWRVMKNFSKDCVLLVLASQHYDQSDYIRNYKEFLTYTKNAAK